MNRLLIIIIVLLLATCEKKSIPTLTIVNQYVDGWLTVVDMSTRDTLNNETFLYGQEAEYFFPPGTTSVHSVLLTVDRIKHPSLLDRKYQVGLNNDYPYVLVIKSPFDGD